MQNIDVVCAWAATLSIECVRMTVKESTYYSYSSLPRTRLYQLYVNMQCTWLPSCWQPSHGPAHDVHGHQPAGNHHANTWGGRVLTFTLTWAMLLHSKCLSQGPCAARACLVKSVSPICDPQTWQTHAVASEIVLRNLFPGILTFIAFKICKLDKCFHRSIHSWH